MPNPAIQDVHVNRVLTDLSVSFAQDPDAFAVDQVFPVVGVEKKSDTYFIYDQADFFRDEMKRRAPGTESAGAGYRVSTDLYNADVWALHKDIDDQTEANYDDPLDADRDATMFLTQQALIRRERQFVSEFFTTSIWTGDQTGVNAAPGANEFLRWNVANSTPVENLRAQMLAVQLRTGHRPNTLVLGSEVWNVLADHAELKEIVKYSERAIFGPDLVAAALGLDRIIISNAIVNTAKEGATAVYSPIAGKHALLLYTPRASGLQVASAGYTFVWRGLLGANAMGGRMVTIDTPMLGLGSHRVEIEMAFDMKKVSAALGAFFATAVA